MHQSTPANQRPILVTGSHRSGSTWVGKMLSLSPRVGYIHEPFNVDHPYPGIFPYRFSRWFTYIPANDTEQLKAAQSMHDAVDFRFHFGEGVRSITTAKSAAVMVNNARRTMQYRLQKRRALLKDPIAFFSAEWIERTVNAEVVVLVRHPAAFVASLVAKDWHFPFADLLEQSQLMDDYLQPWQKDIEEYAHTQQPLLQQAILLWNIFYGTTIRYQQEHPNWIILKHEDLAIDPVHEFEKLYERLSIPFTTTIAETISRMNDASNPVNDTSDTHAIKRNSAAIVQSWKKRLNEDDIRTVREHTNEIASAFYSDTSW